jgi:hypothetical protein
MLIIFTCKIAKILAMGKTLYKITNLFFLVNLLLVGAILSLLYRFFSLDAPLNQVKLLAIIMLMLQLIFTLATGFLSNQIREKGLVYPFFATRWEDVVWYKWKYRRALIPGMEVDYLYIHEKPQIYRPYPIRHKWIIPHQYRETVQELLRRYLPDKESYW